MQEWLVMIGMQYKHQELSGRSSSWHKAAQGEVAGSLKAGSGLVLEQPLQAGARSRGEGKKTMISGGKVQFKREAEQKKKGGKGG